MNVFENNNKRYNYRVENAFEEKNKMHFVHSDFMKMKRASNRSADDKCLLYTYDYLVYYYFIYWNNKAIVFISV